jgi:hypothetical protein
VLIEVCFIHVGTFATAKSACYHLKVNPRLLLSGLACFRCFESRCDLNRERSPADGKTASGYWEVALRRF